MMQPPVYQNRLLRRHGSRTALLLATTALTGSLISGQASAQVLPTGGSVAAGTVAITAPSATQLTIVQTSPSAVVNWQGFSIGQGSAVNIQQPNSTSALLNRVTGDTSSTIAGSLTANGQVYLVNPNGIAITGTGVVNTGGGFVASTLGISDADFQSGKRSFTGNGASADISNAGVVTVGRGGFAALLGGTVSNSGSIVVPLGKVGLGSGERATLDFAGDGFLQVALPTASGGTGALIRNAGTIKANGGSVIISAATAREAARDAVNISGLVQARTIGGKTGSIIIGGGASGDVNVSGRLNATSRRTIGGAVTITGREITLSRATIDASGKTGGGIINIGGGRQGQGPLQQADTLSVDAGTVIRADATEAGRGGAVVLWSNQLTRFAGTISARGGALSGNGGEAEVSGKAQLDYTGFTELSAINGTFGTLLLDPYNVIISNGADTGGFTATGNDSVINATTLQTALGAANVTITTGSSGTQAGNITVAAPLTWSAATRLALTAAGAITIKAPITITGAGGLDLNATAQTGISTTGLTFGNGAAVDYGTTDKGGTFSLNGISYTLVYTMAQLDAIDASNAVDNSAMATFGVGIGGNYALATNLNAAGTSYTKALIGTHTGGDFFGRFDGLGHTITGLTISNSTADNVGLFGYVYGTQASVSNIGLVGGSVTGTSNVGSLVGYLNLATVQSSYASVAVTGTNGTGGLVGRTAVLSTITNSYATGAVTGVAYTGGLVGTNSGLVSDSYATGVITGVTTNANGTGGLTGSSQDTGTVNASYATGAVSGDLNVGGLAGVNSANTSTQGSYATGAVSGRQNVGGLIGQTSGTVQSSYATGAVVATGVRAGGLIGQNNGAVQASYATGAVTGTSSVGGLVAQNTNTGSVSSSYATGAVSGSLASVGGLIGTNVRGVVSDSYSTGVVTGSSTGVGGLVGTDTGTVTSSFWNVATSGWSTSAAGLGLTTAQLQGVLQTGFSSAVWSVSAGLYPWLTWQFAAGATPQALSGIAYQADGAVLGRAAIAGTLNGTALAGTGTGVNGYYYMLLPQGSTAQGSGVFIDIAGNVVKANAYVHGATGSVQNLDLNAGTLTVRTDAPALSSVAAGLANVVGSTSTNDLLFSTPGGVLTLNTGTGLSLAASGAFSIDQNLVVPNNVLITSVGALGIAVTGVVASSGGNATLVAGTTFTNARGVDAIAANGRWLVYSGNPADDVRGGLIYDFKQYAATFGVTAVAQATGNGFLYTVAPVAGLTATFDKIYDGSSNAALASLTTGIDGDVVTLNASSALFDNADAGSGKSVTVSGLTLASTSNGNAAVYGYTLASMTASSTGAITARAITVTADAQSRVYGDANPALTYTVGGSGLVNNDSLSGSLATNATTATGVGSYGITQGSLSAGSNYALTYAAANLTITARPITVTADAQSRVYGDANPALTYTVGGSGLVNNDSLSGSLTTSATTATGVGSYGISQNTLTAGRNYAMTYQGANLSVTARPITALPIIPPASDPSSMASGVTSSINNPGSFSSIDFTPTMAFDTAACCTGLFYEDRRFGP